MELTNYKSEVTILHTLVGQTIIHVFRISLFYDFTSPQTMSAKALTSELTRLETDVNKESLNQKTAR